MLLFIRQNLDAGGVVPVVVVPRLVGSAGGAGGGKKKPPKTQWPQTIRKKKQPVEIELDRFALASFITTTARVYEAITKVEAPVLLPLSAQPFHVQQRNRIRAISAAIDMPDRYAAAEMVMGTVNTHRPVTNVRSWSAMSNRSLRSAISKRSAIG